jgi:hypothetical protein
MPDADAAGARFAADVKASLEAEGIQYRVVSFADVGQKDVSDFLKAGYTAEDLVRRIGTDWVCTPDGTRLEGDVPSLGMEPELEDIAI